MEHKLHGTPLICLAARFLIGFISFIVPWRSRKDGAALCKVRGPAK